ncbi:MAG: hypothetical protein ACEY26_00955 [Candidatus Hodgkinia cicadicola]
MSVGAFVVQISDGSAPTIMGNVLRSVNVKTKAVYLALPSAGGESWSARRVEMLAGALPKGVTLVLDMSDSYNSPLDMFNLRGRTFGPNVIVLPPLARPRMVGIFKQSGDRSPVSLKLVATFNKFIGRLTQTDGATEARRRRAAFNLFWAAKTVCKLRRLRWVSCSAGPDGVVLRFAREVPVGLIQAHLAYHQVYVNVTSANTINASFACSPLYELMISLLLNVENVFLPLNGRRLLPSRRARKWETS